MTTTEDIIRRVWDEGRLCTAEIAEITGTDEPYVVRVVQAHIFDKVAKRIPTKPQPVTIGERT